MFPLDLYQHSNEWYELYLRGSSKDSVKYDHRGTYPFVLVGNVALQGKLLLVLALEPHDCLLGNIII